jgi:outer membrane protein assembly factor BamB
VIAPDYSGRVTAIDATSGDTAWTLGITGDLKRPPRVFQDTLFVATRSSLLAFDAATGTVRWESDPPDRGGLIGEVIGTAAGTVLAVAENATTIDHPDRFLVTGFAIADGSPLWAIEAYESAAVAGDVLVTADRDPLREDGSPARPIDAWAASTGDPLWAHDTRLLIRNIGWDPDHLYLATPPTDRGPGSLAALDPATGTARWVSPVEGTVIAPPLPTADSVIVPTSESRVVGRPTGSVTTMEQTTGTQLWTHQFDQPVRGSPAAVDNVIIVLTADDPPRCF